MLKSSKMYIEKQEYSDIIRNIQKIIADKIILYAKKIFLYSLEAWRMREFNIRIRSMQEAERFVALASAQPYQISVGNDYQNIDGKDFMAMFSLDLRFPLRVCLWCSEEEAAAFMQSAKAYIV